MSLDTLLSIRLVRGVSLGTTWASNCGFRLCAEEMVAAWFPLRTQATVVLHAAPQTLLRSPSLSFVCLWLFSHVRTTFSHREDPFLASPTPFCLPLSGPGLASLGEGHSVKKPYFLARFGRESQKWWRMAERSYGSYGKWGHPGFSRKFKGRLLSFPLSLLRSFGLEVCEVTSQHSLGVL